METLKAAVEITSACLTPVIAVLIVYVAWRQYKTSRDNLRLALYDKRFLVYMGLKKLIITVVNRVDVTVEDFRSLAAATNEGVFLFGSDIDEYIQVVREQAACLRRVGKQLQELPVGEERNRLADEEKKLLDWFIEQLNNSGQKFRKYMSFETQF